MPTINPVLSRHACNGRTHRRVPQRLASIHVLRANAYATSLASIAIIDIGLPRVSGIQVAAALRAIGLLNECRFVALSGYTGDDTTRAIAAARFDVHMTKPMDVERLLSIVASTT